MPKHLPAVGLSPGLCVVVALGVVVALSLGLSLGSCSGGHGRDPDNRGPFQLDSISSGRGAIYPYRIRTVDTFGNPTTQIVNIDSAAVLHANVNGNNGVLPVAAFGTAAQLPNGDPGNQFLHFTFSHKLDVRSILSESSSSQINAALTGALAVLGYDQATESTTTLRGRAFVAGYSVFTLGGVPTLLQAVTADGDHVKVADELRTRAPQLVAAITAGFPDYPGAAALVGNKAVVFVADQDGDLATLDTFPNDRLLRIVASNAIRDTDGRILLHEIVSATTVGDDPGPPQVLGFTTRPQISPGSGDTGIDPTTTIQIRFNKPVQPGLVGAFFNNTDFTPPLGGVTLSVTAAAQTFQVIYHADPVSFGNLCDYVITPAYNLPGLSRVTVTVPNTTIHSLTNQPIGTSVTTDFTTTTGAGVVNAPVAPEAIYVGIGGATPGISVIDLNGFGQGTGDLQSTRFPLNPNIGRIGVNPVLAPGTTNLDAGGSGALTLTLDTNLESRLVRDPVLGSVTDIQIGAPLDLVFNNENINVNATRANQIDPVTGVVEPGNCISVAPHPNPPRLVFPPPNPNRAIFGEEPTTAGGTNLLTRGNPFSSQIGQLGVFGTLNTAFNGPAPPPPSPPPPPAFRPFNIRQQIGHFLYVLDSDNRSVVVLNSNRMTVLDSIPMTDPTDMAVSPNLRFLVVSNASSSKLSFIDINPFSNRFHQVVAETNVDTGPTAVAWQPDGEDVLAVCAPSNRVTIVSASDFTVRRSVSGFISQPVDIAVTPRFVGTGFLQGVYYAYILNGNGSVAIYESGPDGVNGIGFNDMIGTVPNFTFPRARAIRYDWGSSTGSVYIGHVDEQGLGQVSRLDLSSSPTGPLPLNPSAGGFILPPTFRQKEYAVSQRIGGFSPTTPVHDLLSGNSLVDLCLDDLQNLGGAPGQVTGYNLSLVTPPAGHSGKDAVKGTAPVLTPRLLFVAVSDAGKVDVMDLATGRRVGTIDVPGLRIVASYWRQ